MKISLRKRTFVSVTILMVLFIIIQLCIFAFVEYQGWKAHPAEPFFDELEEVFEALALNILLIPAMLILAWWFTRRVMYPVGKISETASRINAGDFSGRIETSGMHEDELSDVAKALNNAFDRYDNAVQRLQRFTGDASHQLRMPITAVKSIGEVAASRDRSAGEYREAIETMLLEMDRLSAVVEQLLQMSRLEAGVLRHQFESVDCASVITASLQIYAVLCEDKNIRLDMKSEAGIMIKGIEPLLSELIGNLIDNAARHTPQGGLIQLGALKRDNQAVIYVHDSGPGIPTDQTDAIFERFYQAPGSDRGKAGLGLALASDIAKVHGGKLVLVNPGQHGARFECTIPVVA